MDADITIIGAGVVGLAAAREVAQPGRNVFLLEQHESFGKETSSRNSEVIHAGVYYPKDTLKAKLCVEGARQLYALCEAEKIPFCRVGKLIVAVNEAEEASLQDLRVKGEQNGVEGLRLLGQNEVARLEPNVRACAGLFSSSTGIFDSHRLMKYFESAATKQGTTIAYGCRVVGVERKEKGFHLEIGDSQGSSRISTKMVINAAGLHAHRVAAMAGIDLAANQIGVHYCKGEYFVVNPAKAKMVNRLVYPSPLEELTGLGIHVTKDLGGRIKLGPNAFYVNALNYDVDPAHGKDFYESVRRFLPFIKQEDLSPDTSGIRPKLQGPGQTFRDFVIRHETGNGLPGLINLLGIESPGLTACLAIAQRIAGMVDEFL